MTKDLNHQLHAYGATMLEDQPVITVAELHTLLDQVSPIADTPVPLRAPAERRYLTMAVAAAVVVLLAAVPIIFGQLRTDEAPATTVPEDPVTTSTTLITTTTLVSSPSGPIYALETETSDGTWRWTKSEFVPRYNIVVGSGGFYALETPDVVIDAEGNAVDGDGKPVNLDDADLRVWLWSSVDGESWDRAELDQAEGRPVDLLSYDGRLYLYLGSHDRGPWSEFVSENGGATWEPRLGRPAVGTLDVPSSASDGVTLRAWQMSNNGVSRRAMIGQTQIVVGGVRPEVDGVSISQRLLLATGREDDGWSEAAPRIEGNKAIVEYAGLGTAVWTAEGQRLSVEVFTVDDPAVAIYTGWAEVPDPWTAMDFFPSDLSSEVDWNPTGIGLADVWLSVDGGDSFAVVGAPNLNGIMEGSPSIAVAALDDRFLLYILGPPRKQTTEVADSTTITDLVGVATVYTSNDGATWTEAGEAQLGTPWGYLDIVGGGDRDELVSHSGRQLVWSDNGIDWTPVSGDLDIFPDSWNVMAVEGGYLAQWDRNGSTGFVGSVDGITWYPIHRPERLNGDTWLRVGNDAALLTRWRSDGSVDALWFGRWVAEP